MSERVALCLRFRLSDRDNPSVKRFIEEGEDVWTGSGQLELDYCETRDLMASDYFVEGVPFVGRHDAGVCFGPHLLFSDGNEFGELPASHDGSPILEVPDNPPPGESVPMDGEFARLYALYLKACELVYGKEDSEDG